jgi:hypothetical protein
MPPRPRRVSLPRQESNLGGEIQSLGGMPATHGGLDPLRALAERVYSVVPLPSHRGV